jgi:hypothetical protein
MSNSARVTAALAVEGQARQTEEGHGSVVSASFSPARRKGERRPRFFRRAPCENVAVVLIGLGIIMLMQPWWMTLFTWSFVTILIGTAMFVIVSHFPE